MLPLSPRYITSQFNNCLKPNIVRGILRNFTNRSLWHQSFRMRDCDTNRKLPLLNDGPRLLRYNTHGRPLNMTTSNRLIGGLRHVKGDRRQLDLVIFGATGFTGKQACKYIIQTYGYPGEYLNYAIAGRDAQKLSALENELLAKVPIKDRTRMTKITKIVADANDKTSVMELCNMTRCVLSFISPPSDMSEAVIASCTETGTDYIDISGELDWLTTIRERYNPLAVQSNTKVISCAGIGHSANDVPMLCLSTECIKEGYNIRDALSVRQYMEVKAAGVSGGSLRTFLKVFGRQPVMSLFRTLRNPYRMCKIRPRTMPANRLSALPLINYSSDLQRWTSRSFMGPNAEAYIRWSNELQEFIWGESLNFDFREISNNFVMSLVAAMSYYSFPIVFLILSRIPGTCHLFPSIGNATFDYDKKKKSKSYNTTVITEAKFDCLKKDVKTIETIRCTLTYPEEMYSLTVRMSVEAAMTSLFDLTPEVYGVTSPTAALGRSYINRLRDHGVNLTASRIPA